MNSFNDYDDSGMTESKLISDRAIAIADADRLVDVVRDLYKLHRDHVGYCMCYICAKARNALAAHEALK